MKKIDRFLIQYREWIESRPHDERSKLLDRLSHPAFQNLVYRLTIWATALDPTRLENLEHDPRLLGTMLSSVFKPEIFKNMLELRLMIPTVIYFDSKYHSNIEDLQNRFTVDNFALLIQGKFCPFELKICRAKPNSDLKELKDDLMTKCPHIIIAVKSHELAILNEISILMGENYDREIIHFWNEIPEGDDFEWFIRRIKHARKI